jgi:hypothetical protein
VLLLYLLAVLVVMRNTIDYVEIATTGNATDFGDLTTATRGIAGCGNQTRNYWRWIYTGSSKIQFIMSIQNQQVILQILAI